MATVIIKDQVQFYLPVENQTYVLYRESSKEVLIADKEWWTVRKSSPKAVFKSLVLGYTSSQGTKLLWCKALNLMLGTHKDMWDTVLISAKRGRWNTYTYTNTNINTRQFVGCYEMCSLTGFIAFEPSFEGCKGLANTNNGSFHSKLLWRYRMIIAWIAQKSIKYHTNARYR